MTTLDDALLRVGGQLGINPFLMRGYAAEDTLPGYYDPTGDEWCIPYAADGKFLYALIRALKPRRVLEIGTARGGSAHHIAMALKANGFGEIVTIDVDRNSSVNNIPQELRNKTHLLAIHDEAEEWLKFRIAMGVIFDFDFIHEDGAHSIHMVHAIYNMLPYLMLNGGVIVSHDIGTGVGDSVRLGMAKAGFENVPEYLYDGSPCGFSVLKYEGVRK